MKVSEYLLLSREERTKHVNLSTQCEVDESVKHTARGLRARKALLEKLGLENDVENWAKGRVNVCHLCEHDSVNGYCSNLNHLYLGTSTENNWDRPEEARKEPARKGAPRKGGLTAVELGVGVHDPKNQEKVREGGRKGGRKGGLKGGLKGSRVTNAKKRLCLVTGHVSNPGGLANYQRAHGVPTHLYAELDGSDLVSQTVLLGLANS